MTKKLLIKWIKKKCCLKKRVLENAYFSIASSYKLEISKQIFLNISVFKLDDIIDSFIFSIEESVFLSHNRIPFTLLQ